MIIGIVGYFTVPSVANYIVHAGGSALSQKVNSVFSSGTVMAANSSATGAGMATDAMGSAASRLYQSMAGHEKTSPYFDDKQGYMGDKLKGNS